jgi:hypothetical protein
MKLLGQKVYIYIILKDDAKLVSKVGVSMYTHTISE